MKLTALIPAYNDAYTLRLCLASLVDHFDEIIVLDDASTDETPDVAADFARRNPRVRYARHEGPQLGWVEARNHLAAHTDSDHLFWLDADDVLCEYQADRLRRLAEGPHALVRLRLAEMWGDLYHTTQRLRHQDRCHLYVNRRRFKDLIWGGRAAARPDAEPIPGARVQATVTGPVLIFHLKGVKPDYRLVQRQHVRQYLRMKERPARLSDCVGDLPPEDLHRLALKMLLRSRQDKLRPTYLLEGCRPTGPDAIWPREERLGAGQAAVKDKAEASRLCREICALGMDPAAYSLPLPRGEGRGEGNKKGAPRRPCVIEDALPGRFRIIYDAAGTPIDRLDTEGG